MTIQPALEIEIIKGQPDQHVWGPEKGQDHNNLDTLTIIYARSFHNLNLCSQKRIDMIHISR